MKERCIMIFPEFANGRLINEIRRRYDPLESHVRPHVTLVFPFASDIETGHLKSHLETVLKGVKRFDLVMGGITAVRSFGNYLFLNIIEGKEQINELHRSLYTGILQPYHPAWLKGNSYHPHMTVGKLAEETEYLRAIEETKTMDEIFQTQVEKISVEIIEENQDSTIEIEIPLEQ